MRFGVIFPHDEIGNEPTAIRAFIRGVEAGGFDFLAAFDHVLGAHPDRFADGVPGFARPPYTAVNAFHELFTLFAYAAGLTERIELVAAVLVLPQRQTALVAKQAAEIAVLSGDRLRLGVGLGWNHTEYEGLNEDFHTRGARVEEQITLLRRLWAEPLVTFAGRWHDLDRVGINPLPARPIPIWMGSATGDRAIRRIARYADGWMLPALPPGEDAQVLLDRLRRALESEGRDPERFGLQAGLGSIDRPAGDTIATARRWRDLGITDLAIRPITPSLGPQAGLARATELRALLADALS
jgi:probable F420-dependent oxidoreductase